MPQFNPYWWINLISWTFAILSFVTWYHQAISFPATLRIQLSRAAMLFYFYVLLARTTDITFILHMSHIMSRLVLGHSWLVPRGAQPTSALTLSAPLRRGPQHKSAPQANKDQPKDVYKVWRNW
uniref:ATP synthase protein 8 n=1 Tax=Powellomyces hirtus TaxID=109895 RepID=A0A4P8NPU8_9FUNG|nr:ATP synthase F0 subunit 8 [Powellomyces hirtus]